MKQNKFIFFMFLVAFGLLFCEINKVNAFSTNINITFDDTTTFNKLIADLPKLNFYSYKDGYFLKSFSFGDLYAYQINRSSVNTLNNSIGNYWSISNKILKVSDNGLSNSYLALVLFMNETFVLNNNSVLISAYNTSYYATPQPIYGYNMIIKNHNSDICKLVYRSKYLADGGAFINNFCNSALMSRNQNSTNVNNGFYDYIMPSYFRQFFNISAFYGDSTINGLANSVSGDMIIFNFPLAVGTGLQLYLKNIELDNIYYGNNLLPSMNVLYNSTILYLLNNNSNVNFSFYIDSVDFENDTIYYADSYTTFNTYSDLTYGNCYNTLGLVYCPISDVYKNYIIIPYSNQCKINTDYSNLSEFYFMDILAYDNSRKVSLALNGECSKNKDVYFKYGSNYPYLQLTSYFQSFNQNEYFNISFYDLEFNRILTTEFKKDNGNNLSIYNNGILAYKFNATDFFNFEKFYTRIRFNNSNYKLELVSLQPSYDVITIYNLQSILNNTNVNYVKLSVDNNTRIYNLEMIFSISNQSFAFSTIKPNNKSFNEIGYYDYKLYTTDSYHLESSYNVINIPIMVLNSDYLLNNMSLLEKDKLIKAQKGLKNNLNKFCTSSGNMINRFNDNNKIDVCLLQKNTYFFIGFVLSLVIAGGFGVAISVFAIPIFFIMFFIFGVIGNYMFIYSTGNYFMFGLCFAVAVATLVLAIMNNNSGSGSV